MQYSTLGFIASLKPEKHLWRTDFVDPISGATYCWLWELGPLTIMNITGWHGEQLTVVKLFNREWNW